MRNKKVLKDTFLNINYEIFKNKKDRYDFSFPATKGKLTGPYSSNDCESLEEATVKAKLAIQRHLGARAPAPTK